MFYPVKMSFAEDYSSRPLELVDHRVCLRFRDDGDSSSADHNRSARRHESRQSPSSFQANESAFSLSWSHQADLYAAVATEGRCCHVAYIHVIWRSSLFDSEERNDGILQRDGLAEERAHAELLTSGTSETVEGAISVGIMIESDESETERNVCRESDLRQGNDWSVNSSVDAREEAEVETVETRRTQGMVCYISWNCIFPGIVQYYEKQPHMTGWLCRQQCIQTVLAEQDIPGIITSFKRNCILNIVAEHTPSSTLQRPWKLYCIFYIFSGCSGSSRRDELQLESGIGQKRPTCSKRH